ncbi:MAG: hypothetical protein F4213_05640 [Boseongicola sp. SB0677_bin_26]|nr:hypothetical protein [Boseongicola sp. SB0677_bin_26]
MIKEAGKSRHNMHRDAVVPLPGREAHEHVEMPDAQRSDLHVTGQTPFSVMPIPDIVDEERRIFGVLEFLRSLPCQIEVIVGNR